MFNESVHANEERNKITRDRTEVSCHLFCVPVTYTVIQMDTYRRKKTRFYDAPAKTIRSLRES
jgi:hypothetical protein